jgi:hypothetical protein
MGGTNENHVPKLIPLVEKYNKESGKLTESGSFIQHHQVIDPSKRQLDNRACYSSTSYIDAAQQFYTSLIIEPLCLPVSLHNVHCLSGH